MKKKVMCTMLAAVLAASVCVGAVPSQVKAEEKEELEFYHGYFHDESEWPAAKVMRDIYDKFAEDHADGPVVFKPIPVENKLDIMNNKVASGSFPDMVDLSGDDLSLAAITQNLVYDMKPYIDEEGIKDQVGLNYTQNDVGGKIYTVHDQLLTLGFWYNNALFETAGAVLPDQWKSWEDFSIAMAAIREKGGDGVYAYGSGEGSGYCFTAALAASDKGQEMLASELTPDIINSQEFADAFKVVAAMDQANGSENSSDSNNDFSADFSAGKSAVFFNGVWAVSSFNGNKDLKPAIFPNSVALSSAGGGLTIADNMSEEKTKLALEFVKYMTSEEVQKKIFLEVGANPCNSALDITALANEGGNDDAKLLAEACSMANNASIIVKTLGAAWGGDIQTAINNKLKECSVSGIDIDAKFAELQGELTALIG